MGEKAPTDGDGLTGTPIATTVEDTAESLRHADMAHGACRNCGATLTDAFCAACGQAAHLHRSLLSLGHDILHGVFHFEGKIWRMLPELFFHPGRLTRRYIEGERARFVSPMALLLFTMFMMFAVFSFTGGLLLDSPDTDDGPRIALSPGMLELAQRRTQVAQMERRIADLHNKLADPQLSPQLRAEIATEIETETATLELARKAVTAAASGSWSALEDLENQIQARQHPSGSKPEESVADAGSSALERRLTEGLQQLRTAPNLTLFKLKTNAYKFSWVLVPMSIPFLWLLFCWRRDFRLYDHAIFVTYSISFVMLLLILCSLASVAGAGVAIWGSTLAFVPPIHLYKQLRGAYGLSRIGALVRLFLLQIVIVLVLALFCSLLLILGLLD